jgi:DNA-binding NarL/FixJ family response regulator
VPVTVDEVRALAASLPRSVISEFTHRPRREAPKGLDELTDRELDVFRLIAKGLSNSEIGRELYISDTTVKTHVTHVFQKLGLRDRVQAVVLAYRSGLFEGDDGDLLPE